MVSVLPQNVADLSSAVAELVKQTINPPAAAKKEAELEAMTAD